MDFNTLATRESIDKTSTALKEHNYEPIVVATKEEALAKVRQFIPENATIMNGASETLRTIGFMDLLKNDNNPWKNLHAAILAETDPVKQGKLRRESVVSDVYLGSVHALTETGEMIIASNTGSQLPHLAFPPPHRILVLGANKIVPTLADGFKRIQNQVIPLEDERMKGVYGYGTLWAKTLVLHKENPALGRKIHVIIVNEALGF